MPAWWHSRTKCKGAVDWGRINFIAQNLASSHEQKAVTVIMCQQTESDDDSRRHLQNQAFMYLPENIREALCQTIPAIVVDNCRSHYACGPRLVERASSGTIARLPKLRGTMRSKSATHLPDASSRWANGTYSASLCDSARKPKNRRKRVENPMKHCVMGTKMLYADDQGPRSLQRRNGSLTISSDRWSS